MCTNSYASLPATTLYCTFGDTGSISLMHSYPSWWWLLVLSHLQWVPDKASTSIYSLDMLWGSHKVTTAWCYIFTTSHTHTHMYTYTHTHIHTQYMEREAVLNIIPWPVLTICATSHTDTKQSCTRTHTHSQRRGIHHQLQIPTKATHVSTKVHQKCIHGAVKSCQWSMLSKWTCIN